MKTKTATHTPGPWFVDLRKVGSLWNVASKSNDIALAQQIIGDTLHQDVRSANARLIAAAPELLNELKSIVAWTEEFHAEAMERQINNAKAAIAKAGGK